MCRANAAAVASTVALVIALGSSAPARAQSGVTAFEGARLIVGDERAPIENATLVVEGARIVQAGRAADVAGPGRRRAREPRRQDRDADARRYPHPSRRDARAGHARSETARLLRRERRAQPRHGQLRIARHARAGDSRGRAVPQRRARDHHARAGTHHGAALDHHRGGRAQGGGGARRPARSTSSRSGSIPATASTRS